MLFCEYQFKTIDNRRLENSIQSIFEKTKGFSGEKEEKETRVFESIFAENKKLKQEIRQININVLKLNQKHAVFLKGRRGNVETGNREK